MSVAPESASTVRLKGDHPSAPRPGAALSRRGRNLPRRTREMGRVNHQLTNAALSRAARSGGSSTTRRALSFQQSDT